MEVLGYVDYLKLTNVMDISLSKFIIVFHPSCGFGLARTRLICASFSQV